MLSGVVNLGGTLMIVVNRNVSRGICFIKCGVSADVQPEIPFVSVESSSVISSYSTVMGFICNE